MKNRMDMDWRRIVYFLPVLLPVMFAAFGTVAVALLLVGQFKTVLVWPLGLLAAGGVAFALYKYLPKNEVTKVGFWSAAFVLVVTVAWMGVNAMHSSQHVYTNRDPGLYVNGGIWLMNHERMQIPKLDVFRENHGALTETTSGFNTSRVNDREIYTQGAHLLPAFMGLMGRIGGEGLLLKTPALLAGLALLGLYSFARMITRQRWAIVATLAFAFSLPAIYLARDAYSEMLATAFVFSSLAVFMTAVTADRKWLWAIAGLMAGVSQLVRVDAILSMAGMVVAITVYLLLAKKRERKVKLINVGIFLVVMGVVAIIGMLDLYLLASGYFSDLKRHVLLELIGFGGVIVAGGIVVALGWWTKLITKLDRVTASWREKWAVILVVLVGIYLALRPLWMISRDDAMKTVKGFTEMIQASLGQPLDGLRTYGEQTVNWLVWYIGPVLTIMAVVGIALTAYKAMKSKDIKWVAMLGVVFGAAVVYLNNPAITPDQIWASRRLVPVILPGIALFGVLGLQWLEERKKLPFKINTVAAVSVLGTLAVVGPLFISAPFLNDRTYVPALSQVRSVCDNLSEKDAVVWIGSASNILVQPTRGICGVPTAGSAPQEKEVLAKVGASIRKKGYRPVVGFSEDPVKKMYVKSERDTKLVSDILIQDYERTLLRPPRTVVNYQNRVWLSIINEDGSLSAIR